MQFSWPEAHAEPEVSDAKRPTLDWAKHRGTPVTGTLRYTKYPGSSLAPKCVALGTSGAGGIWLGPAGSEESLV